MVASVTAAAPSTASRRSEVYAVSGPSTITLTGHGYGHGHGMSQYGAEGAARQGLTWQQIIEFYYPGTSWGELRGPISVWLTGDTTDDVVVAAQAGLTVTRLSPAQVWALPGQRGAPVAGQRAGRRALAGAVRQGRRLAHVEGLPRRRAVLRGQEAAHPRDARRAARSYRGRLRSASPVPGRRGARHGQRAEHGVLPARRRTARDPGVVEPGRRAGAGGRGAHVRRRRALAPQRPALPDLRHHPVPGLRRRRGRAPGRHAGDHATPRGRG